MLFPQLAKSAEVTSLEAFIKDDRWVMEQKLDGNRILLMSPGMDMPPNAITRNGSIYSKRLPKSVTEFRFPEGNWALDGELVGDTFWVFDMPLMPQITEDSDGRPILPVSYPLQDRRVMLETFMRTVPNNFKLVPQAKTIDEKVRLASKALQECFEGLLLKRVDSPYRSGGRTEEWLKVKFVSTADCIVTGVRTDGKDSVDLGLYDGSTIVPVGRASLIGKEKNGTIAVGDVIEVRYLYTGAGGRLYQPTILRKRDDKAMHECTCDQLKMVNKEVLEAL